MNIRVPEVQTCCCCISLRTGAKLFGFMSLVGCLFLGFAAVWELIISARFIVDPPAGLFFTITVDMIIQFVQMATSVCLLLGVYQERAKLILPWLMGTVVLALMEAVLLSSLWSYFHSIRGSGTMKYDWVFLIILQLVDDVYGWLVVYSYFKTLPQNTDQRQSIS